MAAQQGTACTAPVALAQARTDLVNVLGNVSGFTQLQSQTLINNGYDTTNSLRHWKYNRIRDWAEKKATLAVAAG